LTKEATRRPTKSFGYISVRILLGFFKNRGEG
jgi:hypothetical protein